MESLFVLPAARKGLDQEPGTRNQIILLTPFDPGPSYSVPVGSRTNPNLMTRCLSQAVALQRAADSLEDRRSHKSSNGCGNSMATEYWKRNTNVRYPDGTTA